MRGLGGQGHLLRALEAGHLELPAAPPRAFLAGGPGGAAGTKPPCEGRLLPPPSWPGASPTREPEPPTLAWTCASCLVPGLYF